MSPSPDQKALGLSLYVALLNWLLLGAFVAFAAAVLPRSTATLRGIGAGLNIAGPAVTLALCGFEVVLHGRRQPVNLTHTIIAFLSAVIILGVNYLTMTIG